MLKAAETCEESEVCVPNINSGTMEASDPPADFDESVMNIAARIAEVELDKKEMPPPWALPWELVEVEILPRLPVKSLLRFKCVCKSWRNTISDDPSFAEAHTRSHRRQERRPSCLLIAPYLSGVDAQGDFVEHFATPGLWLWQEKQREESVANLMYDMPWVSAEDGAQQRRHRIAHCNGFVMVADAEGTVRVLNPATGRTWTLPKSPNTRGAHSAFGFGRDLGSNAYKVAHFFFRDTGRRGMEVFTMGGEGSGWIETEAEPPYPFLLDRTAIFFKGSLIWTVDLEAAQINLPAHFVRFNLKDESFTIMEAPTWISSRPDCLQESPLAEINEQFALVRLNWNKAEIWVCDDYSYGDGYSFNNPWWVRRHVLDFSSSVHPIAAFDDGIVFKDTTDHLHCDTRQGSKLILDLNTLKYRRDTGISRHEFYGFDVLAYTPTLASI